MEAKTRVVITGLGAISSSGIDPEQIFETLTSGKTSIGDVQSWKHAYWPFCNAGYVKTDSRELITDRKLLKLIKRTDVFGIYAAEQALASSGINRLRVGLTLAEESLFSERFGIYVGTSGAFYNMQNDFLPLIANGNLAHFGQKLEESISPMWLLCNLPNNVLCHVGIRNNIKGPNLCITNQGTSGMLSIIEAFESLRNDEADRALAIGHEAPLDPQNMLYYQRLGLLSDGLLTPFDTGRSGSVLGEGGGALLLETLESATCRSSIIHAEILGKGSTSEANGLLPVNADGDGIARAIRLALDEAGLERKQIGMIVCHGNGTIASDSSEGNALRSIFGSDCPPITSFKWCFGHTIAASACIDTILTVLSLKHKTVPAISNINRIDPFLADLPIITASTRPTSAIALILSRGFGGQNSALIIRAYN